MRREFTGTVYIVEEGRVLLIDHKKLGKWLPPGGHLEENELPHEGALREAREETGLEVALLTQENLWVERPNAVSIPRPYFCLLEELPGHQHIDFIFVGKPVGGRLIENEQETDGVRWFTPDEVAALPGDERIFEDTRKMIFHLILDGVVDALHPHESLV